MTQSLNLENIQPYQGFAIIGNTDAQVGSSVSGVGDINGDKLDDIIIGGQGANDNAGQAYVIYGNTSYFNAINAVKLESFQGFVVSISMSAGTEAEALGCSVSGAGDINGDGFKDIIIGADYADSVYIIYGSNLSFPSIFYLDNLTPSLGFYIYASDGNYLGSSVSNAGDINKDNYTDIIIGEAFTPSNTGSSILIYGGPSVTNIDVGDLNKQEGFTLSGSSSSWSVSGAGNINGDEFDDFIIGAPYLSSQAGITYVIFGNDQTFSNINLPPTPEQGFSIIGPHAYNYTGYSVSGAGDVNGDGLDDIIIGACTNDDTYDDTLPFYAGGAYIVYGNLTFPNTLYLANFSDQITFISGVEYSYIGCAVSGAGDVNGDGIDDIIIGAYGANSGAGEAYIIYGGISLPHAISTTDLGAYGFYIQGSYISNDGQEPVIGIGSSVGKAGDFNGDGYADVIVGSYTYSSNSGIAYVIYGAASGFVTSSPTIAPTLSPTAPTYLPTASPTSSTALPTVSPTVAVATIPTSLPTFASTQQSNINNDKINILDSIEFKVGFPLASFILGIIGSWILRNKVAFYVLDNWGHNYKLIDRNSYVSLKNNEIGLCINAGKLTCIIKNKEYVVSVDDSGHTGISRGLYNLLMEVLNDPITSQSFSLIQSEKNQLRDFLINYQYVQTTKTYCFLGSYTELGYIKGLIYKQTLNIFEDVHSKACRKQVRVETEKQIPIDKSVANPILYSNSIHDLSLDDSFIDNADLGNPKDDSKVMEVSRQDTINLNADQKNPSKGSCIILSIDALVDPKYVELQNKEFARFGKHFTIAYKDLNSVLSYEKDKAQMLSGDSSTKTNALTIHQKSASSNNVPFSTSDNLVISLFAAKQVIEYLPIIKYTAQGAINYFGYNITLPDVLDYKAFLISAHLVLGNAAAQLLPTESISSGMVVSTISSSSYAMRLAATDYLKNQEVTDNPVDLAKQCGTTIAAYTLPNIATCAITKLILPEMPCAITSLDVLASGSLGAMQCYSNYKATVQPSEPTTADIVVPYIADAIAAYALSGYFGIDTSSSSVLMMSLRNSMSAMAAVVVTDSMSRMAIDVMSGEVKIDYIDPVLNCVGDLYSCFVENI